MKKKKEARTPEKVGELADAYFDACAGEVVRREDGEILLDKNGRETRRGARPPTLSGLALALGFSSKEELTGDLCGEELKRALLRARLRVEQYAEERLFDREGKSGAEFELRSNFGWQDGGAAAQLSSGKIVIPDIEERSDD